MKVVFLLIVWLLVGQQMALAQPIGVWGLSAKGLPTYQYTGALPFTARDDKGQDANLPEDPYFLLGNYRMALLTHVSGTYQFLTAERAWARVNAASQTNYGWNDAHIVLRDGQTINKVTLVGLKSIAADPAAVQKTVGVGFAKYTYQLPSQVSCTRILSLKPSPAINTGNPAFVVTVTLKNSSNDTQDFAYTERMLVNFVLNGTQYTDKAKRPLSYKATMRIDPKKQLAIANITYTPNAFLVLPNPTQNYSYDVGPPSVFMYADHSRVDYQSTVRAEGDTLSTTVKASLKPGQTMRFNVVIGLATNHKQTNFADVEAQVADLFRGASLSDPWEGLFVQQWQAKLPDLSAEKNDIFKREMLWNAHMIEASAKYSAYYQETFIPQGTVYSYYFGDNISNRDHLQAALAACYTSPALAKSILRYVIKHSGADGEIKRGNAGFGYTAPSLYKESDEQLFFFYALAEYLLITKDYPFLTEEVACYPAEAGKKESVLTMVKKYFIYLRDEIGTGPNGLVKMLNSDWSDSFFHDYSPNIYAGSAESHLNSVVVLATFPKLIAALKKSENKQAYSLVMALTDYEANIAHAYMRDLGDRKYSARAYLSRSLQFGVDNVCLEPQGYLLQVPGLSVARKKRFTTT
ncbi:hypothetical protein [Spirosoma sp. KNUC1025]|uniref:hypothetical protein n=1 Tax=Spirosoma sp. KNUC1025 TaxID=2894082 RepID=UPI001E362773|nr:hypothetical protein [Spirosoma sp. KNUC1025]UFH57983.1 hypothetical protein LN737_32040 [Spirosoma sp. KNUC1025]